MRTKHLTGKRRKKENWKERTSHVSSVKKWVKATEDRTAFSEKSQRLPFEIITFTVMIVTIRTRSKFLFFNLGNPLYLPLGKGEDSLDPPPFQGGVRGGCRR